MIILYKTYFLSEPNIYEYKNVTYHTCDICFTGTVDNIGSFEPCTEVPELILLTPEEIDFDKIAFQSVKKLIKKYTETTFK